MKKLLIFYILAYSSIFQGQIDSSLIICKSDDSVKKMLNMDAVYDRPFVALGKLPVALGGYVETNWQNIATDGISDGHQFQFRRMTLFVSSSISKKIKFLTELEFEPAENKVSIEFAAIDIEFHPLLNLRSGIILNPIGAFNQNHDGPKWEFTDRPISATQLLPATWSNVGFGLFGKHYNNNWMVGYELYLSSGFDNSIIENSNNKTYLPAAKDNADRFDKLSSGTPFHTAKLAVRNKFIGEIGLSYMGGVYNKWQDQGILIDDKRYVQVTALDFNTTLPKLNTFISAEWAWIDVDIPQSYTEQFGNKQHGGFIDIVQPILKRKMFGWTNAVLNIAVRAEYVDWNVGHFETSNLLKGDYLWSYVLSICFRPSSQSAIRLNYRYQEERDIFNNPAAKTGGFNLGISTYF